MIKSRHLDDTLKTRLANDARAYMASQGGTIFFVDGNDGSDSYDGLSWDNPFKTLTQAFGVSHADIDQRSRWAKRNLIYAAGDSFEEDLTTLARKTDVVGVGSCDYLPMARIIGTHTIGAVGYDGCRFLNMGFKGVAGGDDIMVLNNSHNGIAFIGCDFDGNAAVAAEGAIVATACESLVIEGCKFEGPFTDAVIELGAGECNGLMIRGNVIAGANEGIMLSATATTGQRAGWIIDNIIKSTLCCINDTSGSKIHVVGNRGITLAAAGTAGAGAVVCNQFLASDNQFTCSNLAFMYPLAFDADATA